MSAPRARHVHAGAARSSPRRRTRASSSASSTRPANSTLDQLTPSTREVNRDGDGDPGVGVHVPDHLPDRRLLGRRPQAVGGARAHGVRDPARGAGEGRAPSPASRRSRSCRRRCPAAAQFPVEFVIASTAESAEILGFAQQLQEKATESGMFAFPPLIDVKIDQPAVGDRDRPREGGGAGPRPPDASGRTSARRWAATTSTASASAGAATRSSRSSLRTERLNPEQLEDIYVTGPDGQLVPLASIATLRDSGHAALAQPLPAAQRREDQRRRDPPARRGARVPRGRGRARSCPQGYTIDYTGESRQLRTEGEQVPARVPARGGADLPGARRAVQQLPRSVRHPRRLGAARRCSARSS